MNKSVKYSLIILGFVVFFIAPYVFEEIDPYLGIGITIASIVNVINRVKKNN